MNALLAAEPEDSKHSGSTLHVQYGTAGTVLCGRTETSLPLGCCHVSLPPAPGQQRKTTKRPKNLAIKGTIPCSHPRGKVEVGLMCKYCTSVRRCIPSSPLLPACRPGTDPRILRPRRRARHWTPIVSPRRASTPIRRPPHPRFARPCLNRRHRSTLTHRARRQPRPCRL